jgi:hypothetical protein
MHVLVGLGIFGAVLVGFPRLLREKHLARIRNVPPSALGYGVVYLLSSAVVGSELGGVYYAQGASAARATLAGLIAGLVISTAMALVLAGTQASMYLFRRPRYDFMKAWSRAHTTGDLPPAVGLCGHRRRQASMKLWRRRWEIERCDPERGRTTSVDGFLSAHWDEIVADETVRG